MLSPSGPFISWFRLLFFVRLIGFYSDFDVGPDPTLTETTLDGNATVFSLTDSWNRPSQWLFGAEPHHPLLFHTMTSILHSLQQLQDISKVAVVFVTGSGALQRGYIDAISTGGTGPEPKQSIFNHGWHRTREDSKLVRKWQEIREVKVISITIIKTGSSWFGRRPRVDKSTDPV